MIDLVRDRIEASRGALIPFLTAGFPARDLTPALLGAVDAAGATVIELGLPFSDSLADGSVVQASYHQAIEGGMTVRRALAQLAEVKGDLAAPVVLMASLNPLLAMGLDRFVEAAAEAGAKGLLVPDLPPEESWEFRALARAASLAVIPLAAPGTSEARYRKLAEGAGGFVYQITRAGTTGARAGRLPRGLGGQVALARRVTDLPVCLGFGISTPAQVRQAWRVADGAVVGSALLTAIAAERKAAAQVRRARAFVTELVDARSHP